MHTDLAPRAAERQALSEIARDGTPLALYLDWVEDRHGSLLYHLACAMALASYELAHRGFHLRRRRYPMNLWFALVGESSSGKSVARDTCEDFSRAVWETAAAQGPDPWIAAEGTIPGIMGAIAEHYDPRRGSSTGLLYSDEFSAVLQTKEPIAEMLCRVADGRSYRRNLRPDKRRRGGPECDQVVDPVCSAIFVSTEQKLAANFHAYDRSGGLFSRIWWVRPWFTTEALRFDEDHVGIADDPRPVDDAIDRWAGWLAQLDLLADGGQGLEIGISEQAHQILRDGLFEDAKRGHVEGDDDNAVRLRIIDKARVFGAVFAAMRGSGLIDVDDMERAVRLAKILLEHSSRMGALGSTEAYRCTLRIMRALQSRPDMRKRELYKMLRLDKASLEPIIDTLIDQGDVIAVETERGTIYVHADKAATSEVVQKYSRGDADVIPITGPNARRPKARRGGMRY